MEEVRLGVVKGVDGGVDCGVGGTVNGGMCWLRCG